jgi:hypothetical protein
MAVPACRIRPLGDGPWLVGEPEAIQNKNRLRPASELRRQGLGLASTGSIYAGGFPLVRLTPFSVELEQIGETITKRVQTGKGLGYCAVALSPNGRLKPGLVLVNGLPERHSEGAHYLEWRGERQSDSPFSR